MGLELYIWALIYVSLFDIFLHIYLQEMVVGPKSLTSQSSLAVLPRLTFMNRMWLFSRVTEEVKSFFPSFSSHPCVVYLLSFILSFLISFIQPSIIKSFSNFSTFSFSLSFQPSVFIFPDKITSSSSYYRVLGRYFPSPKGEG